MMPDEQASDPLARVRRIRAEHEASWRRIEGVVAIGTGRTADGSTGVIVSVKGNAARVRTMIPAAIDGVSIDVEERGEIRAL